MLLPSHAVFPEEFRVDTVTSAALKLNCFIKIGMTIRSTANNLFSPSKEITAVACSSEPDNHPVILDKIRLRIVFICCLPRIKEERNQGFCQKPFPGAPPSLSPCLFVDVSFVTVSPWEEAVG